MVRLTAALTVLAALSTDAAAQMPETPGPGGIRIAPGLPVPGYTPGGIGPGGIEVAPGPAARDIPMYRLGPGGIVMPPRPDPHPGGIDPTARLSPPCSNDAPCAPQAGPQTGPYSMTLTIHSRDAEPGRAPSPDTTIDSIEDLFSALRTCWEPPAREQAREGVQMSVRFSFKRSGELMAPPFVTYTTPGTEAATRQVYRGAITAALDRCAPMRFSTGFSAAIAGKPLSVRYVDDRSMSADAQPR
jgi:hypothetical protein